MKTITIDDLMSWNPCYNRDEVLEITSGRESMTPLEIIADKNIDRDDKIWVLLRPEVLGDNLQNCLYDIVDPIVKKHCLHCGVPEVEIWAEKWISGEDRSIESADSAIRTETRPIYAAYAAAIVSAAYAVDGARDDDSDYVSYAAADSAIRAEARSIYASGGVLEKERQRQLDIIVQHLEKKYEDNN